MNDDPGFDPMDSPAYRATVRGFADYFCRLKGIPLIPRVEDIRPLPERTLADDESGEPAARTV